METGPDDANADTEKKDILSEDIPWLGNVSLLFYIPDTVKGRDTMVDLIQQNGGNIVKFHEWFTYQLGPQENTRDHSYYQGIVYSFQWIIESIEQGKLLEKTKYMLLSLQSGLDFPFKKNKIQYTLREIIIIYNWIAGRKSPASRKTWESLTNDGILYCRSRESLKNFWKKWKKTSIEEWMKSMMDKTRYWHNYNEIIRPNQQLPTLKKNKNKRVAAEVEGDKEEVVGEGDDENPHLKKKFKKRKLKKTLKEEAEVNDDEINKASDDKSHGFNEVKQIEEDDGDEEIEEEAKEEEIPEEKDEKEEENKKEVQRAKKPEVQLEDSSVDGVIEGDDSPSEGFPSLSSH